MTANPTPTPDSTGWDFRTLALLWDWKSRAIITGADRLESLSDADRARSVTALSERVRVLTADLDDSLLVATACVMVEDLYKSCFNEFRWSPGVPDYLAATAGVLVQELEQRGLVLHYVIDNVRSAGDLGPALAMVSAPFQAAGMWVTGPQLMALELMESADQRSREVTAIPSYRDEGHYLADRLIERCHRERRSSVYLNLDLDDDTPGLALDVAQSPANTPGTIVVVRNQSPSAGSTVQIAPPPGVSLPTFGGR